MGFDALGFHAMGEWITNINPSLIYKPVSRPSVVNISRWFKKRADY